MRMTSFQTGIRRRITHKRASDVKSVNTPMGMTVILFSFRNLTKKKIRYFKQLLKICV